MDQKKTLWIVTAAGVFLAVVVLFALILNKPNPTSIPTTASITTIEMPVVPSNTEVNNSDSIIEGTAVENLAIEEKPELENETLATENVENIATATDENSKVEDSKDDTVVIDLNQVTEEKSSVTAKNQVAQNAINNTKQTTRASTIYTAPASTKTQAEIVAEKKAAALNSTKAKTVTVSKKVEPVEQVKYWIQCASYTSKKSADNARFVLDEKSIPAEVFTYKDSKDKLYYRVRVGPYTTKSEAEYWKNRICSIETFANSNSYITMN